MYSTEAVVFIRLQEILPSKERELLAAFWVWANIKVWYRQPLPLRPMVAPDH